MQIGEARHGTSPPDFWMSLEAEILWEASYGIISRGMRNGYAGNNARRAAIR
jgi:hypothetical protein